MSVLLEAIGQLLLIGVLLIIKESPIMALFVLLPLAVVQTLTLSVVSKNRRLSVFFFKSICDTFILNKER